MLISFFTVHIHYFYRCLLKAVAYYKKQIQFEKKNKNNLYKIDAVKCYICGLYSMFKF